MIEVEPFNFRIHTDGERQNYTSRTLERLGIITPEECAIIPEFHAVLGNSSEQLSRAMGRVTNQEITKHIADQDSARDGALDFIDDTISLYEKRSSGRYSEATQILRNAYDTAFMGININNNSEQSVGIDAFLQAIAAPDVDAAITSLRLNDEISTLRESHPRYKKLIAERAKIREESDTPLLKPTRHEMFEMIRALESFLNFKIHVGSELHADIARDLNAIVTEIGAVAKARATRKSNGE